jgi:CPA2 family monovalent cation:H+ antiporter-2
LFDHVEGGREFKSLAGELRRVYLAVETALDPLTLEGAADETLVVYLLVVLGAGLIAGSLCKWLGVSLLAGFMLIGALIGEGGLHLLPSDQGALSLLSECGALLLLFSVGLEFTFADLRRMGRLFVFGGPLQMALVAVPMLLICRIAGLTWAGAWMIAVATALSSTVLVFRALAENGQTTSEAGRRAIGILLFQDVALVPLLLLIPVLADQGGAPAIDTLTRLAIKSLLFVAGVWALQRAISRLIAPWLMQLRSVELLVLFALCLLGVMCRLAHVLGLPVAIGALAAGLALTDQRFSHQIDSILLPFRESFAAVFFVTLGSLLKPAAFFDAPLTLTASLIGVMLLKWLAGSVSLHLTGLAFRPAIGMGMGLAQLGEFSFVLMRSGVVAGLVTSEQFNRVLFLAIGSLIATPMMLKLGLRLAAPASEEDSLPGAPESIPESPQEALPIAVVIGIGPIGRHVSSQLETAAVDVRLIDLSPVNLQPFAQAGFATFAGDARDTTVLERAGVRRARLIVVCVPTDPGALEVTRAVLGIAPAARVLVRCRFEASATDIRLAGASRVISEEGIAAGPISRICLEMVGRS